jgi:hypothetical protein
LVLNRYSARCVGLAAALLGVLVTAAVAQEGGASEHGESHGEGSNAFSLDTYRTWYFRSFLPDAEDDADTLGLEFNTSWGWGDFDVVNIAYLEVADYPVAIPGQPIGNPEPDVGAATGINDLLTAFLFSGPNSHHGRHHVGWGFAGQLPTGDSDTLTSGKYSFGPAFEYAYEGDRLFMAFVALQLWSVAGDSARKDVNLLMIKPMITYDLNPKWKAVYMPYGVSVYWNKPAGQKAYVPLGGGIQRQFNIGSRPSAFSAQLFRNVIRPDKGTETDFRLMLEVNF